MLKQVILKSRVYDCHHVYTVKYTNQEGKIQTMIVRIKQWFFAH